MDQEYVLSCTYHWISKESVFILQNIPEFVECVEGIWERYNNNLYAYMDWEYVLRCTQHWICKEPVFILQNVPEFVECVEGILERYDNNVYAYMTKNMCLAVHILDI